VFQQHLRELDSIDISQFHSAKMSVNVLKNRFPDILPCKPLHNFNYPNFLSGQYLQKITEIFVHC